MYFFCYSIVSSKFTHHNAIFWAKNKGKGRWLACGLACLWGLPLAVWLVLCLEANHFGNTVGSELLDGLVVIFWVLGRQLACGPPPLGIHSGYGSFWGQQDCPLNRTQHWYETSLASLVNARPLPWLQPKPKKRDSERGVGWRRGDGDGGPHILQSHRLW